MANEFAGEGWDLLSDAVAQRARKAKGNDTLCGEFSQEQRAMILAAATDRGVSLASFVQRAALAVAAYDLGIPWLQMAEDEQRTWRIAEFRNQATQRAGADFGPWQIEGMS